MGEFEILGEVEGARGGGLSVNLEVEHSTGVTRKPETTKQLGDDAKDDLHVIASHDDATGYTKVHRK